MTIIEQERTTKEEQPVAPAIEPSRWSQLSETGKCFWTAAELIEEYGWVKNHSGSRLEGFCAIGALAECSDDFFTPSEWATWSHSNHALVMDLVWFNDSTGRTQGEVVDRLRELAPLV